MITPTIRGIYIADVKDDEILGRFRGTKHCVCVAVGGGLFLLINTRQNTEYDDFTILADNYDFLNGEDRYLGCRHLLVRDDSKLLRKVGDLNDMDAKTVYEKIRASTHILDDDKQQVLSELWASFR